MSELGDLFEATYDAPRSDTLHARGRIWSDRAAVSAALDAWTQAGAHAVVFEDETASEFDAERQAIPSAVPVPNLGDSAYTFAHCLVVRTGTSVTRIIAPADTDQLTALAHEITG